MAAGCSIIFVFFKNKPPTPPSHAAAIDQLPFMEANKLLFSNKDYLLLLVFYSFVLGAFNSLATIMELLMKPFGYDDVLF